MNVADVSSSVWFCIAVQVFWLVQGLIRFARRNDEMPLVTAIFFGYCGGYRYFGSVLGWFQWADLAFFGLAGASSDFSSAALALEALVLGESVLLATYCHLQKRFVVVTCEPLPSVLRKRLRMLLAVLVPFSIGGTLVARFYTTIAAAAGKSLAFEVSSYMLEFPMLLVAVAILTVLAWRFDALNSVGQKVSACAFLGVVTFLTFGAFGRFQFLGWMIASTYLISTSRFGLRRILILAVGGALTLAFFGVAGAMRGYHKGEGNLMSAGFERAKSAEDGNMLDGFVFLMKVYPQMLPYGYGREHFDILLRPIPRSLWHNKPVGGYMNKLGLFNAGSSGTTGISPSLFGSFYQEGGWIGIVICSMVYGWVGAWIVRYSTSMRMVFGTLIRACLIAACVPIFRGGDLPGIYAWVGMAFWPVLFFLWWNRKFFFAPPDAVALIHVDNQRWRKTPNDWKIFPKRHFKIKRGWRGLRLALRVRRERGAPVMRRHAKGVRKGDDELSPKTPAASQAAT
jgi:hypothetical protein